MNRKRRIASILTLTGFLSVMGVSTVFAASPLLSGYGAPGGGEQAVIGSTLLGSAHHGAGSASSGGHSEPSGATSHDSGGLGGGGSGSGGTPPNSSGGTVAGSRAARGASPSRERASRLGSGRGTRSREAPAYVYPSTLRLASSDSSVLAISAGDLLLLIATVAVLVLVGVLTVRLARLQR
jgi:hypothetical protein